MKKSYVFLLVALVSLAFVLNTFGQRKTKSRVTWEYKRTGIASQTGEQELNKLGAEGWELVSVDDSATVFYLKRPR